MSQKCGLWRADNQHTILPPQIVQVLHHVTTVTNKTLNNKTFRSCSKLIFPVTLAHAIVAQR